MTEFQHDIMFSVVTPSFNQGQYIETTILSVLSQDFPCFEHMVVDGGSSDETLDILGKYPHLKWVSEQDRGQADALNKGLRMARGNVIAWINSDDWYEPGAFRAVASFFSENPDKSIVMGDCNLVDGKGKLLDKVVNHERGFEELRQFWIGGAIPTQPAIFFRKELLDSFGYLDESLYYAMDYDLWMRFARKNRFHHIDLPVANYRFHPSAKGGDMNWSSFVPEWKLVCERYADGVPDTAEIISAMNGKSGSGLFGKLLKFLQRRVLS